MFLNPSKMIASFVLSVLILAFGSMLISGKNPVFTDREFLSPLASTDSLETVASDNQAISTSDTSENAKIDEQISPENATMEVEAMMASIDTNYLNNQNNSSYNNSDWSLELISDHALEINR